MLPLSLHHELLRREGALLIARDPSPVKRTPGQPGVDSSYVPDTPELFVALLDDGGIHAFSGHVDLGTGIWTALTQIVAEELCVPLERVAMHLGHTAATPNQGPTIASMSIQISSVPLRRAAAQAREYMLALAAEAGRTPQIHADLLRGKRIVLKLADEVRLKPASEYRIVGSGVARLDIPAKATGQLTYVHDVRVPGMRHGRVIRPPYRGRDSGGFVGRSLKSVDPESVAGLPGKVRVVVEGDFVGVVADREEQAAAAARLLAVQWHDCPPAPDLSDLHRALHAQPGTLRPLLTEGDVDEALSKAPRTLRRQFVWPYQMHGSIGPSCSVADFRADGLLKLWSGSQNPHMMRPDLAKLLAIDEGNIEIIRMEAAGCYGRNCADDVCGDAALLSRADGAPVRVQLSRDQEHVWEPKGSAQTMDVRAALGDAGEPLAYELYTRYPSNDAPLLALLLTGRIAADPRSLEMGDRTAVPPYRYANMRIACHDMPSLVRTAWLRGVSSLPNSFAHDSMIDELAALAGADPVEYRIRHLDDARARDLIRAVADRAGWQKGAAGSRGEIDADGKLRGRGVAYARYVHSRYPGFGAAWSAWVIDIEVDPHSGRITVPRITVGQDTGMMINPQGVRHQIHGNVIQSLSRVLMEKVQFDRGGVASREWGTYPIIGFRDVPAIDVVLMDRQDEPPMGSGESASVPSAAAVANALFDATGVRFRSVPFTPDVVQAALREALALPA